MTRSDWVRPPGSGGGGGGDTYNNYYNNTYFNEFDQDLNTTSNVNFNGITLNGNPFTFDTVYLNLSSGGIPMISMYTFTDEESYDWGVMKLYLNGNQRIVLDAQTGKISAKDWSNVSITTSQISDYSPGGSGTSSNGIVYPAVVPLVFRQSADISTTDSLNWVNTEMSMVLYPSNTYTLSCDILFTGAAATTGQAINLTNTASVSNPYIMYDTWSTATAPVGFSTNVFNTVLTGTGSGAAVIRPNKIIADFTTVSGGNLTLRIRSEVATSATTLLRGSQCLLYNVSNLRTTPVKNASGTYPAQKRLITNVTTTSNTVYTPTELSFNGLTAGRSYTLNCDLVFAGQAATTGQAVNVSTTAGYSNAYIIYDTWSSATANVGFSATAFPTSLIGTGSGASILKPNKLIADFTATSGGTINLSIRSEVSGSFTTLMKGSMCLLYDNNGG